MKMFHNFAAPYMWSHNKFGNLKFDIYPIRNHKTQRLIWFRMQLKYRTFLKYSHHRSDKNPTLEAFTEELELVG